MSERPTPETDAFRDNSFTDRVDETEKLYDFAEKLERELDEAREQRDAWEKIALSNAEKLGALLFGKTEGAK
jgi:hypothetical protein